MKRSIIVGLVIGAAIGGAYTAASLVLPGDFVPADFVEARRQGAEIAQRIVTLSDQSFDNLDRIAQYDREGNTAEALILISNEVVRTSEMRQEALNLSLQLEQMAKSIGSIRPDQARMVATEAVSSEVALVSRLLSYNDLLVQLFETLRFKFQKPGSSADEQVQNLIDQVNAEVRAINASNKRFNESLASFDALLAP